MAPTAAGRSPGSITILALADAAISRSASTYFSPSRYITGRSLAPTAPVIAPK